MDLPNVFKNLYFTKADYSKFVQRIGYIRRGSSRKNSVLNSEFHIYWNYIGY